MNGTIIPMRPTATGIKPTVARVRELRECGWIVQKKLNGDRVLLERTADGIMLWNRYGTEYGFSLNTSEWSDLPVGTVLDGEGYQGRFIPFDVVARDIPLVARLSQLAAICDHAGVQWCWEADDQYIRAGRANGEAWEGIVAKDGRSKYYPLKKPHQESVSWLKLKW